MIDIRARIDAARRRRRARQEHWMAYFGSFGDDFFSDD